ncbi:hypothetical protein [Sphingosinicella terrae]|uniref:hypothetical protein n=1 Tax=Sphingosinicella terrae TaxID=2172047 RepID=UPI000E0D20BF|nr:hypothetical protein [Sphingosinicella terrae]
MTDRFPVIACLLAASLAAAGCARSESSDDATASVIDTQNALDREEEADTARRAASLEAAGARGRAQAKQSLDAEAERLARSEAERLAR